MTAVEPEPEVAELFSNPQCSPVIVEQEHRCIEAWVDGYFREAPELHKTRIAQTRQSTRSALARITEGFLSRWGDDSEAALHCLQGRNRLWDLFVGNRRMFETFVTFGVLRNFDVLLPSLADALSKRGWEAGPALLQAIEIQAKGVSLVRNDQGIFRWLV